MTQTPLLRLLALGVLAGALFATVALTGPVSAGRVRGWTGGDDAGAALAFIAISAALTVALFPGPLLAAASGFLFGTALGTCLSIAAAVLGAVLAFTLARTVAGDVVERLGGPRLRAAAAWVGRRGFVSVLYARIAPLVPYTVVNYAAGLTPVRLLPFAAATAVGVAPRAFAYTALGGSFSNLGRPEALIAIAVLIAYGSLGLWLLRRDAARAAGPETGSSSRAVRSAAPR